MSPRTAGTILEFSELLRNVHGNKDYLDRRKRDFDLVRRRPLLKELVLPGMARWLYDSRNAHRKLTVEKAFKLCEILMQSWPDWPDWSGNDRSRDAFYKPKRFEELENSLAALFMCRRRLLRSPELRNHISVREKHERVEGGN